MKSFLRNFSPHSPPRGEDPPNLETPPPLLSPILPRPFTKDQPEILHISSLSYSLGSVEKIVMKIPHLPPTLGGENQSITPFSLPSIVWRHFSLVQLEIRLVCSLAHPLLSLGMFFPKSSTLHPLP